MSADDLLTVHQYRDGTASVRCSCGFESVVLKTDSNVQIVAISHRRACRKRAETNVKQAD